MATHLKERDVCDVLDILDFCSSSEIERASPVTMSTQETWSKELKSTQVTTTETEDDGGVDASHDVKLSAFKRLTERFWLFEIGALIVSTIGLIAVVITLKTTEGKPMPTWQLKGPKNTSSTLTINAILSLFATMVKATVLIPVGAAMGELKWMWFSKDRLLTDVQVFEDAARGPLGSAMMLWKFRGKGLASLGAVVVIGSLTLDFAFQQLVTYPLLPVAVGNATVARTNYYDATRPGWSSAHAYPELGLVAAVYKGLYTDNVTFTPAPTCLTGNCTWTEPYTSLGICSKCYDTTFLLNKTCSTFNYALTDQDNVTTITGSPIEYCNYTLPSGQQIAGWDGTQNYGQLPPVLNVAGQPASPQTYFGNTATSHLTSFSAIRANWTSVYDNSQATPIVYYALQSANATECGLDFCVIKYQGREQGGQFTEQIVDTFVNTTATDPMEQIITPPDSFTNQSAANGNNNYGIPPQTSMPLTQNLFMLSGLSVSIWQGNFTEDPAGNGAQPTSDIMSRLRSLDEAGMNITMQSLAGALTQRMRIVPGDGANQEGPGPFAIGTALQDKPHVNVRWAWISLPAAILFLSAVFLAGTMIMSSKKNATMLWKGSGLAHYHHALTEENQARLASAKSAKHFEKIADGIRVRYGGNDVGGGFVSTTDAR